MIRFRSFVVAWQASMRTHELMADSRMRFATRLNEMSEELNNLVKEVDKNRKVVSIPVARCSSPRHRRISPRPVITENRRKTWQLAMSARCKNQSR